MIYRRLDENGDYSFGRGINDFLTGREAVAQLIKTRLLFLKGEWWENVDLGLPLFESIIGIRNTGEDVLNGVDLIIQDVIIGTEGVLDFNNYSHEYNARTRELTIKTDVNTIYGEVAIILASSKSSNMLNVEVR